MPNPVRASLWLGLLAALPVPVLLGLGLGAIRDVERVDREQRIDGAKSAFTSTFAAALAEDPRTPALPLRASPADEVLEAVPEFADARLARADVLARSGRDVEALEALEPSFAATTPPRIRVLAMLETARVLDAAKRGARAASLRESALELAREHEAQLGAAFARYVRQTADVDGRAAAARAWALELADAQASAEELLLAARLVNDASAAGADVDDARTWLEERRAWPKAARELARRAESVPPERRFVARVGSQWFALSPDRSRALRVAAPKDTLSDEVASIEGSFADPSIHVDPGASPLELALPPSTLFRGVSPRALLIAVVAVYALLAFLLLRAVVRQQRKTAALAQARADLVAQVTHELRTPLAVVRLYGESLLAGRVAPDAQRDYLETIAHETARLGGLVDRVAAAAHAEEATRPRALERLDPGVVVRAEADAVARIVAQRGGSVECVDRRERARTVLVASDELRLVFDVLLDNALRYGGSPPRLRVELDDVDTTVRIAIRDHGPGIDPRERDRVFERFERGSAGVASGTRGAGMGLWLARRAARAVGGDVTFEFPDDGGTRAVVTLPVVAREDVA